MARPHLRKFVDRPQQNTLKLFWLFKQTLLRRPCLEQKVAQRILTGYFVVLVLLFPFFIKLIFQICQEQDRSDKIIFILFQGFAVIPLTGPQTMTLFSYDIMGNDLNLVALIHSNTVKILVQATHKFLLKI